MDFEAIKARLQARVPALRLIEDALSLTALTASQKLPLQSPAAYVVPAGVIGGKSEAMAGAFVQSVQDVTSIVLSVKPHNATGAGKTESVGDLIRDVIEAVCGWAPAPGPGVYELRRCELQSMQGGIAVWRIDLSINDQLRIAP